MKHIFIISFSQLHRDPRVRRQVKTLSGNYKITCAGFTDVIEPGVDFWEINFSTVNKYKKLKAAVFLITRQFSKYYWQRKEIASLLQIWKSKNQPKFDLIIANDIETLKIALQIAKGCPVFLDAHEYSPRQSIKIVWRLLRGPFVDWQCRNYLGKAALVSTVNRSLSLEYEREYGKKSIIIYSAPTFRDLEPSLTENTKIRLVHHGGAARQRGLEEIINLMKYLDDRYTLDLYLVALDQHSKLYMEELLVQSLKYGERVSFREPAPTDQLPEILNQYDIGVALIQPKNFNYAHCLPNKFFEFVQARLILASGPTPDMKELIDKFDLGIVSDDFSARALAEKIACLSADDVNRYKQNVHNNAYTLSFQDSAKLLLDSVQSLI